MVQKCYGAILEIENSPTCYRPELTAPTLPPWAAGLATYILPRQPFTNQNRADVLTICLQPRTQATVIALLRALGTRRATAGDALQRRLTIGNELTETTGCRVSEFSFAFAARKRAGFRSVKSDKAMRLPVGANSIAINDRY